MADRTAYAHSGAEKLLAPALQHRACVIFDDFAPNPKFADVIRGVKLWYERPCDIILAAGGGSAIDMAKLIGLCAGDQEPYRELLTCDRPIVHQSIPLIVIPTTAGTGSEATHFAVVYIDGQKYSVAHEYVLPEYAIIDSNLTASLPATITAHTGLDALAQAIESLWSVNATEESREFASEAVTLVLKNLEVAVHNPTSAARFDMCRAAHLAGKAIIWLLP